MNAVGDIGVSPRGRIGAELSLLRQRISQGNAVDALYNRLGRRLGRPRRLLRRAHMDGSLSSRRLNMLARGMGGADRYLEIGLFDGRTFDTIEIAHRVGVDPEPQFDLTRLPVGTSVHAIGSDDFFQQLDPAATFDLAFVDGLHTYEQTYRDILHVFAHLTQGGLVLVDDVVPRDEFSALRDQADALAARAAAGDSSPEWQGDVFVVIKLLTDHHSEITVRTIVGSGNPQAVLWRAGGETGPAVTDAELASHRGVTYDEVFAHGVPSWFNPLTEAEAIAEATAWSASRRHNGREV